MEQTIEQVREKAIEASGLPDKAKQAGRLLAIMGQSPESIMASIETVMNHDLTVDAEKNAPVKSMPKKYTMTEKKLHQMLIENTGVNYLDSGGYNNRSWQKNREIKDFRDTPVMTVDIYKDEILFSKSVFHYLRDQIEYTKESAKMTTDMTRYGKKNDVWGLCLAEDYVEKVLKVPFWTFNTYNGESLLEQVLQAVTFSQNDKNYIALQIHGGCDVRGGYTEPVVFEMPDEYLYPDTDVMGSCKCGSVQSDDAGYHWYESGIEPDGTKLPAQWIKEKIGEGYTDYQYRCNVCNDVVNFFPDW